MFRLSTEITAETACALCILRLFKSYDEKINWAIESTYHLSARSFLFLFQYTADICWDETGFDT